MCQTRFWSRCSHFQSLDRHVQSLCDISPSSLHAIDKPVCVCAHACACVNESAMVNLRKGVYGGGGACVCVFVCVHVLCTCICHIDVLVYEWHHVSVEFPQHLIWHHLNMPHETNSSYTLRRKAAQPNKIMEKGKI